MDVCIYVCIFQESHSCIQMDSYNLVYTKTIIRINPVIWMWNILKEVGSCLFPFKGRVGSEVVWGVKFRSGLGSVVEGLGSTGWCNLCSVYPCPQLEQATRCFFLAGSVHVLAQPAIWEGIFPGGRDLISGFGRQTQASASPGFPVQHMNHLHFSRQPR